MPIPVFDPSRFPLQRANMPTPDYSGMVNFIPQALQSYQGTLKAVETPYELRHQRMMNMEKLKEQAFKNALAEEFGRKEKEAEIASKLAYAQYYQQGGGNGNVKGAAPSYTTKILNELADAEEGWMPGSNKTIPISGEQQQQIVDRLGLAAMKHTTDAGARQTALRVTNLIKTFERTNVNDLTRYSGPAGAAKLKIEEAKDAAGHPSKEYLDYLKALTAVQYEAEEIRQTLGSSISEESMSHLREMTNPVGFGKSSKAAKAQIEAGRNVLRKQLQTLQKGIQGPQAFQYQEKQESKNLAQEGKIRGIINGKQVVIPRDKIVEFNAAGGQVYED